MSLVWLLAAIFALQMPKVVQKGWLLGSYPSQKQLLIVTNCKHSHLKIQWYGVASYYQKIPLSYKSNMVEGNIGIAQLVIIVILQCNKW